MAINKIQTSNGTENILGNIGIRRNGNGYLIAGDMESYNGDGNDNPFTIDMDLATINGKSINKNGDLSVGLMHLSSYGLSTANDPTTIGKELYLAYLPFTTTVTTPTFPVSYSFFSSIPYYFIAYPVYERLGAHIAAGIINLGRTVAMTLEEGDVLFGLLHRYRVRNSLAVDFIGKWYVIDNINILWVEGADRPETVNISGHCVNRTVDVSYSYGVTSDVTTPDENDTFNYYYTYRDFGGEEADENVSLNFNSNYFRNFYSRRIDLPFTVRHTSDYYSSGLDSTVFYIVTAKMSAPPVKGLNGFISAGIADLHLITIDTTGTPTPCYTEDNSIQLYSEAMEQVSETVVIGGNSIVIGYNKRTHQFNPNLPTLLKPLQPQLVSGTNIKTVNNQSILGEGNITIEGGDSYTAGDNITIENGVISAQVPQQRVLVDEDDDSGLHSGFIVHSPHWRILEHNTFEMSTWNRSFFENLPADGADQYVQSGFLVPNRMTFTVDKVTGLKDGSDWTFSDGVASGTCYIFKDAFVSIDGVVIDTSASGEKQVSIHDGSVFIVDEEGLRYTFGSNGQIYNALDGSTVLTADYWNWNSDNSAYIVHNGAETQLADAQSVASIVSSSVGSAYVGKTNAVDALGSFTGNKRILLPDDDYSISRNGQESTLTVRNGLANTTKNLTIGFDTTYSEKETVNYYSYQDGIEAFAFFGDNVYGGSWAGEKGTFVENTDYGYGIRIPVEDIRDNLTYGNGLCFYTDDMSTGQNVGMYLTISGNALQVSAVNGSSQWYDEMTGMNFDMANFVEFVVNGVKHTYSGGTQTLLADVSALTDLFILPTGDGNSNFSMYSPAIYIQVMSSAPTADNPASPTLWKYEDTGYVNKNYENAPEKLNHYIRFAGETGSVVGNRKAYILTDLNVAQAAYIQQLETRIAALETRLNNYNGKGMPIEAQYPGSSVSE